MDVTNKNFEELLPEIEEDIRRCCFISLDTELTGLWENDEPKQLDLPDGYYGKYLTNASNFICLQIGISIFKLDTHTNKYSCKSYNFHIFPRQLSRTSKFTFACQPSSIEFLVGHNFDFNKVFYEGISYMNLEREDKLSKHLEERRFYKEKNADRELEKIEIPKELCKPVKDACDKLSCALDADEEVRVAGHNGYVRRLIYQTIKERYPNGELCVETKDGVLVARSNSGGGQPKDAKTQLELDEEVIDKAVGFSKVMRAISKSGKLVVGHNMFLDICHILNHFFCYLPQSYKDFKDLLHTTFPWILDTKYLSKCEGMRDIIPITILEKMYDRLAEEPFVRPQISSDIGYGYPEDSTKYHDAGFDSYVTGVCFIGMFNYIANPKNLAVSSKVMKSSTAVAPQLNKYVNRIFLNNSTDCHIYLGGPDPVPNRSHYFFMAFPSGWVNNDIIQLFSPFGRVRISWIDTTSAWVSLNDESMSGMARSALCAKPRCLPAGVDVQTYDQAVKSLSQPASSRKRVSDSTASLRSAVSPGGADDNTKRLRPSYREVSLTNRGPIKTTIAEQVEDEAEEEEEEEGSQGLQLETETTRSDSSSADEVAAYLGGKDGDDGGKMEFSGNSNWS